MSRIPNYFHFVFGLREQNEPFHLLYYLCLKSCIEVNQPDKVYFYYLYEPYGTYWEIIKPHLELQKVSLNTFVDSFEYTKVNVKRHSYAHHADFIRLEKLVERGGVYADIDTLFVKKLPQYLFEKPFVLGREPDIYSESSGTVESSLCNALIMAEKDSFFGKKWLEEMTSHFNGTWSNHSTLLPQKLSEQYPEMIHIEPQRSFYHFEWTPEGLKDLFEQDTSDTDGVYSIHLWKHLWFSRWRNDFSTFHGRMLDEEYVRKNSSTYAKLAKPYLPSEKEKISVNKVPLLKGVEKRIKKSLAEADFFISRVYTKIQSLIKAQ